MEALRKAVLERKRAASSKGEEAAEYKKQSVGEEKDAQSGEEESEEEEQKPSAASIKQDIASKADPEFEKTNEYFVLKWIERMLDEWSRELSNRPHPEASTAKGREALAAAKECQTQLAPLIQLLKTQKIDRAMLAHLFAIIQECEMREYRRAFDRYIQLTIGNAPWPIGVTMVGIHARSGREKISDSKVSHIMKDETARAYMTSFKRLMTKCQALNPPDAPSKRMN